MKMPTMIQRQINDDDLFFQRQGAKKNGAKRTELQMSFFNEVKTTQCCCVCEWFIYQTTPVNFSHNFYQVDNTFALI